MKSTKYVFFLFTEEPKPSKGCPRQNGYFKHPDPQVNMVQLTCSLINQLHHRLHGSLHGKFNNGSFIVKCTCGNHTRQLIKLLSYVKNSQTIFESDFKSVFIEYIHTERSSLQKLCIWLVIDGIVTARSVLLRAITISLRALFNLPITSLRDLKKLIKSNL